MLENLKAFVYYNLLAVQIRKMKILIILPEIMR